ncbi:MAG TPA: hypothetical protein V6D14_02555 [Coleofasciculaceae cyanobacterium]|jgi:hypothetical protein
MLANAPKFDTITGFDYILTPTQQGWQLTVWEKAEVTENRICPFLWKFKVELATLNEVHSTIQSILGDEKN